MQARSLFNLLGFIELRRPIRPSEYMDVLAPLLPSKYAPLRSIGTGLQSVYLTRLPEALAAALIDLIGVEARDIIRGNLLLEACCDSVAPSRPFPKGAGEDRPTPHL